jgi:hypothetical protein
VRVAAFQALQKPDTRHAPAGLDVRKTALKCGVDRCKTTFALLHQPERIAHDLAGIVLAPAGKLRLNECSKWRPSV